MSYADINGLSMYYEEHGQGDPLVLLHGGIAGGEIFAGIASRLAEGRRVIVPDLQGHGRTADIDRPLRPETLADDVAALIAHLGLERADVLGYSLGGHVTWRLAIQHPDRVRRIVVISTPCRRDGSFPEVLAAMDAIARIEAPTMLVFADADSVRPDHVVELFRLLGGGLRDAGWDGSARPVARLAVLPGRTHYDVVEAPGLVDAVVPFLEEAYT